MKLLCMSQVNNTSLSAYRNPLGGPRMARPSRPGEADRDCSSGGWHPANSLFTMYTGGGGEGAPDWTGATSPVQSPWPPRGWGRSLLKDPYKAQETFVKNLHKHSKRQTQQPQLAPSPTTTPAASAFGSRFATSSSKQRGALRSRAARPHGASPVAGARLVSLPPYPSVRRCARIS